VAQKIGCLAADGNTIMKYPVDARECGYDVRRVDGKIEAIKIEPPTGVTDKEEVEKPMAKKGKK